jgi:ubiquinone/menaquinone biosynthesis C-methylase UbiE
MPSRPKITPRAVAPFWKSARHDFAGVKFMKLPCLLTPNLSLSRSEEHVMTVKAILHEVSAGRKAFCACWIFLLALTIASLCLVGHSTAEPQPEKGESVRPGINDRFLDPDLDVDRWVKVLEGESREIYVNRHKITEALRLEPGMAVADIGVGTGLFVELFAQKIGHTGQLYAVDIAPKFVEHIRDHAAAKGLAQVKAMLGREDSVTLPANSIEVAFVCNTYHHFEYPQSTLASIHRALRPGGALIIIEFERIPGKSEEWVLNHVRASKAVFTKETEAAGFRLVEEVPISGLKENYFLRFIKP